MKIMFLDEYRYSHRTQLPKEDSDLAYYIETTKLRKMDVFILDIKDENCAELWRLNNSKSDLYELNSLACFLTNMTQVEHDKLNDLLLAKNPSVSELLGEYRDLDDSIFETDTTNYVDDGCGIGDIDDILDDFEILNIIGVSVYSNSSLEKQVFFTLPNKIEDIEEKMKKLNLESINSDCHIELYNINVPEQVWTDLSVINFRKVSEIIWMLNQTMPMGIYDGDNENIQLLSMLMEIHPCKDYQDIDFLLQHFDEAELIKTNCAKEYAEKFMSDNMNKPAYDYLKEYIDLDEVGRNLLQNSELMEVSLGYLKCERDSLLLRERSQLSNDQLQIS